MNWWPHYGKLFTVADAVMIFCYAISFFLKAWRRTTISPSPHFTPPGWAWTVSGSVTLLFAATLALFVSSAVNGLNIAVLGMLTIPSAITAALAVETVAAGRRQHTSRSKSPLKIASQ